MINFAELKKRREAMIIQQAEEKAQAVIALKNKIAEEIARTARFCASTLESEYVYGKGGSFNYNIWQCQGIITAKLEGATLKELRDTFPHVTLTVVTDSTIKIQVNQVETNMVNLEKKRAAEVERKRLRSVALREKLEQKVASQEKQCLKALEDRFVQTGSFAGYENWRCQKTKVGILHDEDLKILKNKFGSTVTFETGRYDFYDGGWSKTHQGIRFTIHPSHFGVEIKK